MILKEGQIINDGDNDLVICAINKYDNNTYAYILNSETNEVGFYRVKEDNGIYDLELVEDEKQIQELILVFSKTYAEKNPNALKEVEALINLEGEKEDE